MKSCCLSGLGSRLLSLVDNLICPPSPASRNLICVTESNGRHDPVHGACCKADCAKRVGFVSKRRFVGKFMTRRTGEQARLAEL